MPDLGAFIYIAALGRTGSTLLNETLMCPPHCYIFTEPRLGASRFSLKASDTAFFGRHGIALQRYQRYFKVGHHLGWPALGMFKRLLMPKLLKCVARVGVKEVDHTHWREYLRYFPEMRAIVTARDPRDMYISTCHMQRKRGAASVWPVEPAAVAQSLNRQFEHQLEIMNAVPFLTVRYEDLCTAPELLQEIRAFAGCPAVTTRRVGHLIGQLAHRREEMHVHDGQITEKRAFRWRREQDPKLLAAAQEVAKQMNGYCTFWGYDPASCSGTMSKMIQKHPKTEKTLQ